MKKLKSVIKNKINKILNFLFKNNKIYNKYIFTKIYEKDLFNVRSSNDNSVSKSGSGSDLEQTKEIIKQLPLLLKKYNIKSILDVPCGDFYWMQHVNLKGINYIGSDIVKKVIETNTSKYQTDTIKFMELDIINDAIPRVDLILCRDLLVHLNNDQIIKTLKNIKKSNCSFLLTTSFKNTVENRDNDKIGFWRPINLELEPFNFKNPIDSIFENCTEANGKYNDKQLILFQLIN
jgi:2-polyprenyl-3-methyl-5-hydroxy-6-metoxy-1,4-benzoquinol methylase